MRAAGKGLSGTWAWRISAPERVERRDGCNPRGRTTRSSPHSRRRELSERIISGLFELFSGGAVTGALSAAAANRAEAARQAIAVAMSEIGIFMVVSVSSAAA